jgi:uridine kinase
VLILEGIFALHDPRILAMLDLKIFCEADADVCLSRRLLRDVECRGRDIQGCMKQWFSFVKPNFHRWVLPQREMADIIVPRGVENTVAIDMISDRIHRLLKDKSYNHRLHLSKLASDSECNPPPSSNISVLSQTPQIKGIHTLLNSASTSREIFGFYFDRLASLLIEHAAEYNQFQPTQIETPEGNLYMGLKATREISAVVLLRGGSVFEAGLRRVIPDCRTGRILIQTPDQTEEPELHYLSLAKDIADHGMVLLLDGQICQGGAILMAVKVLVDHGVEEGRIVVVTYTAGQTGLNRLLSVFPDVRVVATKVVSDREDRWVEKQYLGC